MKSLPIISYSLKFARVYIYDFMIYQSSNQRSTKVEVCKVNIEGGRGVCIYIPKSDVEEGETIISTHFPPSKRTFESSL